MPETQLAPMGRAHPLQEICLLQSVNIVSSTWCSSTCPAVWHLRTTLRSWTSWFTCILVCIPDLLFRLHSEASCTDTKPPHVPYLCLYRGAGKAFITSVQGLSTCIDQDMLTFAMGRSIGSAAHTMATENGQASKVQLLCHKF